MNCNFLKGSCIHLTSWNNAQYINPQEFLLLQKLCFCCCCTWGGVCVCVCTNYWWFPGENGNKVLEYICSLRNLPCVPVGLYMWFTFLRNERKRSCQGTGARPSSDGLWRPSCKGRLSPRLRQDCGASACRCRKAVGPDRSFVLFKEAGPKQPFVGVSSAYKVFFYNRKQRKVSSFCGRRPHKIETFS